MPRSGTDHDEAVRCGGQFQRRYFLRWRRRAPGRRRGLRCERLSCHATQRGGIGYRLGARQTGFGTGRSPGHGEGRTARQPVRRVGNGGSKTESSGRHRLSISNQGSVNANWLEPGWGRSLATGDAQPLPLFQQLTRGDPPHGDDVHSLFAIPEIGRRSAVRAWYRYLP